MEVFQLQDQGVEKEFLAHQCSKCGAEGRLHSAFGRLICTSCKNDRPNKMTGNSGMYDRPQEEMCFVDGLFLERVSKSNGMFGSLFFSHYPESKGIVGRALCYLVYLDKKAIGIIGCSSPPKNYLKFKEFFDGADEKQYVVNNVFRLIRNDKNLATKVLKIFRNLARKDYANEYKETLLGMATFVEPPRTGTIYKADNWKFIGMTEGIRMRRNKETWEKTYEKGVSKYIYAIKYR